MLVDELLQHHPLGQGRIGHALKEAAIDEKVRLAGVAQHLPARILTGQRNAREIDVRGDVFLAHLHQRIGVCLVRLVAHHRAHVALRVVVLGFGKAVVDQKGRAACHALRQGAHPGLGLRMHLGEVVVHAGHLHRRAQVGRAVLPDQRIGAAGHAAFVPNAGLAHQQLHRHRIEHLVAHHHCAQAGRQLLEPLHPIGKFGQLLFLALDQRARELDDHIAPELRRIKLAQQLARQRTGAGAKLPDLIGAGGRQRLRHLLRQGPPKMRRQLGGGDKVAARLRQQAKFAAPAAVVAPAWRVQGQRHEGIKTQPAAGLGNGLTQRCRRGRRGAR